MSMTETLAVGAPGKYRSTPASAAGLLIFIWGTAYPQPYEVALATGLVLPLLAIAIAALRPRGFTLSADRGDPRVSLAGLFAWPAMMLAYRANLDVHLLDWTRTVLLAASLTCCLIAAACVADAELFRSIGAFVAMALLAAIYGYGGIIVLNRVLDTAAPRVFSTTVLAKYVTTGTQSEVTAHARLSPWGPIETATDVDIPQALFDRIGRYDIVCVEARRGAFDIPWFTVRSCR